MRTVPIKAAAIILSALPPAHAGTLCTAIAEARTGQMMQQRGDCATRVTPASTFKLALAVIGFDTGVLTGPNEPVMTWREGDPDWGGDAWKQPTDPTRWLKYSVVWYSQRITHALGAETLARYAHQLGFGNADFSGDPGKDNGLDRAWLTSSLKVSPLEQVAFLRRLVNHDLGVKPAVYDQMDATVEVRAAGDWKTQGKTGMAFPRRPDGTFDEAHAFGWFVGWAVRADRRIVFAHLIQDDRKEETTAGVRAREEFLAALPALAGHGTP